MWNLAVIVVIFAVILVVEIPVIAKKDKKRDLWVFCILMFVAFSLGVAKSLRMSIPNPLDLLLVMYKPVSDAVFSLVQ
ncbi:hypothetical protein [Paenibacillus sp. BAC0078]